MLNEENIYCTVPEDAIEHDADREQVLDFLRENQGRFYTAREIAKACNLPTRGTQVEVRKAVTKLIEIDMQPIMSNAKGFSYVTQSNQMWFYSKQLEERMQGLQRRITKVREIARKMECDGI
jgi:hypothetical protein